MASLTAAEAVDEILALLKTAADAAGYEVDWRNIRGEPPDDDEGEVPRGPQPWLRPSILHAPGTQTIGQVAGERFYERNALLTVECRVASGQGLSAAYALAKIVADAYEGKDTPSGAWFRDGRIQEVGVDGEWYAVNFLVSAVYYERK